MKNALRLFWGFTLIETMIDDGVVLITRKVYPIRD